MKNQWISVKDKLPEELETVWAYDADNNLIYLGCIAYNDGWMWAVSNDTLYIENGKIVSECEMDDEYNITHWMPLPEPPKQ